MGEQRDQSAIAGGETALLRPLPDGSAVGRIAEDAMATPVLLQPVFTACEEQRALGVGGGGAWIKGEVELVIEGGEEGVGRRPLLAPARIEARADGHGRVSPFSGDIQLRAIPIAVTGRHVPLRVAATADAQR